MKNLRGEISLPQSKTHADYKRIKKKSPERHVMERGASKVDVDVGVIEIRI